MMRLPEFTYVGARTVADAAAALADDPAGTRLVAGGTDLWPNLKRRHQGARIIVGLRRVADLRGIASNGSGEFAIGAMTTLSDIVKSPDLRAAWPGLVKAVASISTPVLRNMGTIGGNLALDTRCTYYDQNEEWRQAIGYCMKEAGETCWVRPTSSRCLAVSSTDSAPVLCALGARVELVSREGTRTLPLSELYADDGITYLTKRQGEVITRILLPAPGGMKTTYWKLRRRGSIDFPVLGVGVALTGGSSGPEGLEIWLGGIESRPRRLVKASDHLRGRPLDEAAIGEAAKLARREAGTSDNTDYELGWRLFMVERYVDGALRELAGLQPRTRPAVPGAWAV